MLLRYLKFDGDLSSYRFRQANTRAPPLMGAQKFNNYAFEFVWPSNSHIILVICCPKMNVWGIPSSIFFARKLLLKRKTVIQFLFYLRQIHLVLPCHLTIFERNSSFWARIEFKIIFFFSKLNGYAIHIATSSEFSIQFSEKTLEKNCKKIIIFTFHSYWNYQYFPNNSEQMPSLQFYHNLRETFPAARFTPTSRYHIIIIN
jgi:hypothetical protein